MVFRRPSVLAPESFSPFGGPPCAAALQSQPSPAVLWPERFRAGCAFGGGPRGTTLSHRGHGWARTIPPPGQKTNWKVTKSRSMFKG